VPDKVLLKRIPDPTTKNAYVLSVERSQKVDDFNDNYMSLATVLMGPYFALGLLLFFRKRQRNFAEISIAFILFTAFVTVIEILWVTPFRLLVHNQTVLNVSVLVDLILQTVYISCGLGHF